MDGKKLKDPKQWGKFESPYSYLFEFHTKSLSYCFGFGSMVPSFQSAPSIIVELAEMPEFLKAFSKQKDFPD